MAAPVDFFNGFPADAIARVFEANPRIKLEFELNDAWLVHHSRRQLPRAASASIEFATNTIKELGLMQPGPRRSRARN